MADGWRVERDAMGEVRVPADRRWGAQTQRSLENFPIGEDRVPFALIRAMARVKQAAARAHRALGTMPDDLARAIEAAAEEVALGGHREEFPLVVWQTGSGTQSHMNVNEVVANLASERLGRRVHPNDEVNLGQSSNDVVPTALHLAAVEGIDEGVLPALVHLRETVASRAREWDDLVKIGRTHWMDATPLTVGQEVGAWAALLGRAEERLLAARPSLLQVALGGTAVGTGLNAPPGFPERAVQELAALTGRSFVRAPDAFAALSVDDAPVAAHGALQSLAVVLVKIANDIRFLASGPRSGIGELMLPANEPGSSIMPGKVNPTQAEAMVQVCGQVFGNHAALTFAATQASGQLSLTRPQVAFLLGWSARLLGDACRSFADRCIAGMEPDRRRIGELVDRSLMLVTALTPHIGYDAAARIAKHAHQTGATLREAAIELGLVDGDAFDAWVRAVDMVGRGQIPK